MKTTILLVTLLFGCASQVELTESPDAGDSGSNDAPYSITVSQCANGQCHRLTVDDTCRCPNGSPVTWTCEQCKDGSCATAIPNTTCPNGCTDCFQTCHSIYLSTLTMPYSFQFTYTCGG